MGKQEIIDFLKKNYPKKFSAQELVFKLKYSPQVIYFHLSKLVKRNNIEYKIEENKKQRGYNLLRRYFYKKD